MDHNLQQPDHFSRLKTDTTGSGIAVGAGNFAYQFSGHGDKVPTINSFQSENILEMSLQGHIHHKF